MAGNLSVVLGVDSTGFKLSIEDAKKTLEGFIGKDKKLAEQLRLTSLVTEEQARSFKRVNTTLLKVSSGAMSTTQAEKVLAALVRELKIQFANLSDTAKNSDFGKAVQLSCAKAEKHLQLLQGQLQLVNTQLKDSKSVNGETGVSFDKLSGIVSKYAGVLAVATGAFKVLKDAFLSSEDNIDEWGRTVEGAKSAYTVFCTAINSGNWNNFFSNLTKAINGARELYNTLDRLGSIKTNNQAAIAIAEAELLRLRLLKQQGKDVDALIKATEEQLKKLKNQSVEQGKKAGIESVTQGIIEQDPNVSEADARKMAELLIKNGQNAIDFYDAKIKELEAKAGKKVVKTATGGGNSGFVLYLEQEVVAVENLTEKERKQLEAYRALHQAESANPKIAEGIQMYADAVREALSISQEEFKVNKWTGAGSGSGNEDKKVLTFYAKLKKELEDLEKQLEDLNPDIEADNKKIKELNKLISGQKKKIYEFEVNIGLKKPENALELIQREIKEDLEAILELSATIDEEDTKREVERLTKRIEKNKAAELDLKVKLGLEKSDFIKDLENFSKEIEDKNRDSFVKLYYGLGNDSLEKIQYSVTGLPKDFETLLELNDTALEYNNKIQEIENAYIRLNKILSSLKGEYEGMWIGDVTGNSPTFQKLMASGSEDALKLQEILDYINLTEEGLSFLEQSYKELYAEVEKNKLNIVGDSYNTLTSTYDGIRNIYSAWSDLDDRLKDSDGLESFFTIGDAIFNTIDAIVSMIEAYNTLSLTLKTFETISAATSAANIESSIAESSTIASAKAAEATAVTTSLTEEAAASKAAYGVITEAGMTAMGAETAAAYSSIPFVGPALAAAAAAQFSAMVAAMKAAGAGLGAFANGGIVQGSTTLGDYNLIRANAGEMVLNNRQQANLFRLLNGSNSPDNSSSSGNVTFRIEGQTLVGVLNNYQRKHNKIL